MDEFKLTSAELKFLRHSHRETKRKRDADRIKTIVLLGLGWTSAQIGEALLMDDDTIKRYLKRYQAGGLPSLLKDQYKAKQPKLTKMELEDLFCHLQDELYLTVQEIIVYVKKKTKVAYSVSGMTDLLHRLGFVYKKPKIVPGKADPQAQKAFIKHYDEIKKNKRKNDPIYFMDGTHPQHNTMSSYGWIQRGHDKEIKAIQGDNGLILTEP